MAWSNSKVFRQYIADLIGNTTAMDFDADTIKVALYNNSITPDNDVSAANSAYNVGQWATAQEQYEAAQWDQGGVALTSKSVDVGTADQVLVDAADTSSGANADLANVYGCLVYDDTIATPVAKQGICYNYFGGANSVVNGTFTVRWATTGIFRFTF